MTSDISIDDVLVEHDQTLVSKDRPTATLFLTIKGGLKVRYGVSRTDNEGDTFRWDGTDTVQVEIPVTVALDVESRELSHLEVDHHTIWGRAEDYGPGGD